VKLTGRMPQIALIGVGALVGAVAATAPVSGQSDGEVAPIYGIKYLQGYRDRRLISVKRLTGKQLTDSGAELRTSRTITATIPRAGGV
jgi:hypothetical protein